MANDVSAAFVPIHEAPAGQVTVIEGHTVVLTARDFSACCLDHCDLRRVRIDRLPDRGLLSLEGEPLGEGTWVDLAQLDTGALRYRSEALREGDMPSLAFVVDAGEPRGHGVTRTLRLAVLHTLRVDLGGLHGDGWATWRQDPNADLAVFGSARIVDRDQRGQQVAAIVVEATALRPGDCWCLDDAYATRYHGATGTWPGPLEWTEDAVGRTVLRPTDGTALTPAQAESLLRSIRYRNTLSAPDESPRTVSVRLVTADGETSSGARLSLTVQSALGEALRDEAAHRHALRSLLEDPPACTGDLIESCAPLAWLLARSALANRAWSTLGMARPMEQGNVVVGGALMQALAELGVDTPLVLDKPGQQLRHWMLRPLPEGLALRDSDSGLVWMSSSVQAQLLRRIGAAQHAQRLLAWQEVSLLMEAATPDEQHPDAVRLRCDAGLLSHLGAMGIGPQRLVRADEPTKAWAADPIAWVAGADGQLWLSPAARRELGMRIELRRHADLNPMANAAALAFQVLHVARAEGTALLVSAELPARLARAGVSHGPVLDTTEPQSASRDETGVFHRVPGGLLMDHATRDRLAGELMERLIDQPAASALAPLGDLLREAPQGTDAVHLPADVLPVLQRMGFPIRWVHELGDRADPGDAVRDPARDTIALSHTTLATLRLWVNTLSAEPAVTGPAGSPWAALTRAGPGGSVDQGTPPPVRRRFALGESARTASPGSRQRSRL